MRLNKPIPVSPSKAQTPSMMNELEYPAMIQNPGPTARLRAKVLASTVAALLSGAMLFGASVAVAAETDPIAGARGDYDAAAGTYTVGAGDNLSAIAKRFGTSVGELETANDLRSDDIAVGQELKVAAADAGASASAAGATGDKPNILFIMGDDIGLMQPKVYHRGWMVGETPNIDRIAQRGRHLHGLFGDAELHLRQGGVLHRYVPGARRLDRASAPRQPGMAAPGHADIGQDPARSGLQHRAVRQEPLGRPYRVLADRARIPGVLGLSLPPGCHAAGELPRHQQDADRSGLSRRRARTRRSPA